MIRIHKNASYLPTKRVLNKYFEERLDTSDEWIKQRTGIQSRFFVEEQRTSDLALSAVRQLGLETVDRIKAIVVSSFNSDYAAPNIACLIHRELKLPSDVFAVDINMGCSGYVGGLRILDSILEKGELGLLVAAEAISPLIDFTDRSTAILFGDGASATLVSSSGERECFDYGTIGNSEAIFVPGKNHATSNSYIQMNGKNVFKFATKTIPKSINRVLKLNSVQMDDIKYIIPHQANQRIIESAAKKLKVPADKFFSNISYVANTSSASIGIALSDLISEKQILKGDRLLLCGFGAGLIWLSTIVECDF